jgi:hypothetical protein
MLWAIAQGRTAAIEDYNVQAYQIDPELDHRLTTELLMIISRTATQGEGLPSPPMDDVCDAAATRIIQLLEVSITEGHC